MNLEEKPIDLNESFDRLYTIVSRVLIIQDYTYGDNRKGFLLRFRGMLRSEDSAAAYDQLANDLSSFGITPLFRWEEKRHAVILVSKPPEPAPSKPWLNLVLFIVTLISVIVTGGLMSLQEPVPQDPLQFALALMVEGFPFAIAMITVLAAHELGHYFAGKKHGVKVTLPYFIPLPIVSPFGTMGAFISMKGTVKNRRDLLDIGIAGPLAGLVVSIPILIYGLSLSTIDTLPIIAPTERMLSMEGNSLLYLLIKYMMFGKFLPSPASFGNLSEFVYWVRYFFTGIPFPWGGTDVMIHPIAWAGWAGLLVTSMNLIPAGQLDGGHILYTLLGRDKMKKLVPVILVALGLLGIVWSGWWLWAAIVFFMSRLQAEPLDQITTLDQPRKVLAVLAVVIFFLTFVPLPLAYY